jgi:hypothetical protein
MSIEALVNQLKSRSALIAFETAISSYLERTKTTDDELHDYLDSIMKPAEERILKISGSDTHILNFYKESNPEMFECLKSNPELLNIAKKAVGEELIKEKNLITSAIIAKLGDPSLTAETIERAMGLVIDLT